MTAVGNGVLNISEDVGETTRRVFRRRSGDERQSGENTRGENWQKAAQGRRPVVTRAAAANTRTHADETNYEKEERKYGRPRTRAIVDELS